MKMDGMNGNVKKLEIRKRKKYYDKRMSFMTSVKGMN